MTNDKKKVIIPTLKTLKPSLSTMSDEELDSMIGNVRADRRKLISDAGKVKRRGKKATRKKKTNAIDLMTAEEKADLKAYLEGRNK